MNRSPSMNSLSPPPSLVADDAERCVVITPDRPRTTVSGHRDSLLCRRSVAMSKTPLKAQVTSDLAHGPDDGESSSSSRSIIADRATKKLKSCLSNPDLRRLQSSSGSTRQRRSVEFSQSANCTIIPHKTPEELLKAWYNKEERNQLQKRARRAVKLRRRSISEGALNEAHGESGRGIEHFADRGLLERLKREQDDVINAVLVIQEHWKAKGLPFNAKELAYTSYTLSTIARERAYLHGAQDAAAAKGVSGNVQGIGARRSKSLV